MDGIENKLDELADLYSAHRREGHTHVLFDGVKYHLADAAVVAADDQHARVLRTQYPSARIHSLSEHLGDRLRGRTVAVVLDNATVARLCVEASTRIRKLLKALSFASATADRITRERDEALAELVRERASHAITTRERDELREHVRQVCDHCAQAAG